MDTVDELRQATDEVLTDGNSGFGPDARPVTCRTTRFARLIRRAIEDKPSTTQRQCLELERRKIRRSEWVGRQVWPQPRPR